MTVYVLGCRLRVEVEVTSTGEWLYAEYDRMTVESETDNYRLNVTGYHGNAGDAFNYEFHVYFQANGMEFSTPDRDNDQNHVSNCAFRSGWWFRHCSISCLNEWTGGLWYATDTGSPSSTRAVSATRMMLQCGEG